MEQIQSSQLPPMRSETIIPKKRGGKLRKILLIAIALIVLGGAGAYIYLFDPLEIFRAPDRILKAALKNFSNTKTLESVFIISGVVSPKNQISPIMTPRPLPAESHAPAYPESASADNARPFNFTLTLNSAFDSRESGNPKTSARFKLNADNLQWIRSSLNISFDSRLIDNVLYLKIDDLSFLGEILDSSDLNEWKNKWENKWIKLDFADMLSRYQNLPGQNQQEIQTNLQEQMLIAKEINQKIRLAVSGSQIINITGALEPESVEGINSYHYKFNVDKDALIDLLIRIWEIQLEQSEQLFRSLDNPDINELGDIDINKAKEDWNKMYRQNLEKVLEKIRFSNGEIWIAKKDKFISRIKISIVIEDDLASAAVNAEMVAKNFNMPVTIDAPVDAIPIEEIAGAFYGESFLGPGGNGPAQYPTLPQNDLNRDSDSDGLPDNAEAYFGTDPNNPDSDGDGYKDGEEVQNRYNPLGPGKLNF